MIPVIPAIPVSDIANAWNSARFTVPAQLVLR